MPIGCGQAFCASRQQSLDLSFQCNLFSRLDPFPFSSDLMSSHLISSHLISCLVSFSRRFSADHNSSHLFSCHLGFSHLLSDSLNSCLFSASLLLSLVSAPFISLQLSSWSRCYFFQFLKAFHLSSSFYCVFTISDFPKLN